MHRHKEIEELIDLIKQFDISIEVRENKYLGNDYDYIQVALSIKNEHFDIYVQDEYEDMNETNQALCLCLVLLELEDYMEEDDYLTWCKFRNLSPEDVQVRDYYMDLRTIYSKIEHYLGVIESPIASHDLELNSGAIQVLRQQNKSIN